MRLRLTNSGRHSRRVRVQAVLQGYGETATATVTLPPRGMKQVGLNPSFKASVAQVTELTPVGIRVQIFDEEGRTLHDYTKQVDMLARHAHFLGNNMERYLAVFVTPNDPGISRLLAHVAEAAPGHSLTGYQREKRFVHAEVKAVYETITALGVHYRSQSISFLDPAASGRGKAQRMTFPAESLQNKGANCIDGALLFASVFEAMGLDTCLILVPKHALVGVRLHKDATTFLPVETTCVGKASFEVACQAGLKAILKHKERATFVWIADQRKAGITPFPYSIGSGLEIEPQRKPPPSRPSPTERDA
jgi:hypothetical protein